jgi:hypothetical protein
MDRSRPHHAIRISRLIACMLQRVQLRVEVLGGAGRTTTETFTSIASDIHFEFGPQRESVGTSRRSTDLTTTGAGVIVGGARGSSRARPSRVIVASRIV